MTTTMQTNNNSLNNCSVIPIPAFKDNYIWLIINHFYHTAVAIDPGDANPVLEYIEKLKLNLIAVLITHHHRDHTGGVIKLTQQASIPVYGPAKENILGITHKVKEGDKINLPQLGTFFHILDIPGHTAGHIAYYGPLGLFCGDTLFGAGCGRLFEGTASEMLTSLQKLTSLPDNTPVYSAHEYTEANLAFAQTVEPHNQAIQMRLKQVHTLRKNHKPTLPSTIALEKATNPFLRSEQPSVKAAAEHVCGQKLFNSLSVFTIIRAWKDTF